jgi:uncharacterized membrane protein YfcA
MPDAFPSSTGPRPFQLHHRPPGPSDREHPLEPTGALIAFAAAFAAGAINSVAGGGTLVSFPTLVWLGLPATIANATNTVAIWPGAIGGMWGYRRDLAGAPRAMLVLVVPSLAGGIVGAFLLASTPPGVFERLVPYLILFATVVFMLQEPVQRRLRAGAPGHESARWLAGAALFQFAVAVYGGYFGAGIGILMLAALGVLGQTDMHQMNGLKNFFAVCINGVAAIYFLLAGMVHWPFTLVMMAGAVIGGYLCAGVARRLGRAAVRRIVIGIGFAMAISLLIRG